MREIEITPKRAERILQLVPVAEILGGAATIPAWGLGGAVIVGVGLVKLTLIERQKNK